jgi:glutamine amidotransferase
MVEALEEAVAVRGVPFLGICVGMQLMATRGFEHGENTGLGWIAGDVVEMAAAGRKVPHMGWNDLDVRKPDHPVLNGIATSDHAYFVHSYQLICADEEDLLATVEYGGSVTAMVARGNCVGTQFHPEKSQDVGLRLISNFLTWRP